MSERPASHLAPLADRGVVSLTGPDTRRLLQGIVTNDIDGMGVGEARYAALLSPQGKVLSEFFVVQQDSGVLLDVAGAAVADLIRRLTLYRLRAAVVITDLSSTHGVAASWGVAASSGVAAVWGDAADDRTLQLPPGTVVFTDPRHPGLGRRLIYPLASPPVGTIDAAAYHAHRIDLGVPEGGRDFAFAEVFAHDALLDQLNGVSFTKGCYVGQEIVSRMQHRGTARTRIVKVEAVTGQLPTRGAAIMAGDAKIGTLGSVESGRGLAMLRVDRAAEAIAGGVDIRAGDVTVRLSLPTFATFALAAPARHS
jgi:tRNA-modifying protein YgfZ